MSNKPDTLAISAVARATTHREAFPIQTGEQFLTVSAGLTPAEQRLMWRLRQLVDEGQSRGAMIIFEDCGFALFRLSKRENIGT